jgi:hypothetical protein
MITLSTLVLVSCSVSSSGGNTFIPVNDPADQATFNEPLGIIVKGSNVYIAEGMNAYHGIHQVTGNYIYDFAGGSGVIGSTDGTGLAATFNNPYGLAADASGNIYVADYSNHKIRKVSSAGVVTTFAGSGVAGVSNGTGAAAQFNNPIGLAFDISGNLYVADSSNNKIRKITISGVVTDYAGTGAPGSANSTALNSTFDNPTGLAFDTAGNLFVSDASNFTIRKIATGGGSVTLFAGTAGATGNTNGTGTAARFEFPAGMVADSSNNLYVADFGNHCIRKITSAAVVTTYIGLCGVAGNVNGSGTVVRFNSPSFLAIDASNNIYVSESVNKLVRIVTSGLVTSTFAGK